MTQENIDALEKNPEVEVPEEGATSNQTDSTEHGDEENSSADSETPTSESTPE